MFLHSVVVPYNGSSWMVANVFHQGFFRSWYDDETYEQILNQMQTDHSVRWLFSDTISTVH